VQILSTKQSPPPLRSNLVPRSRLIQKLNQGLECGLVLVSAPAGYGKSTLLSTWVNQVEFSYAWISLDDKDNDPARFLAYLTAAIREIDPSIDEGFENITGINQQPDVEALLTAQINHLSLLKKPCRIILDDYHLIQDHTIHQAVSFLLEHRPDSLHLVIATRADPPLPLARLRARSDMLELRMSDLRFTPQEAADFLNHTMRVKVSPEDVARLTKRTEGWIAGLQMAALSMQNTNDLSGFITAFTGSHHYIFDYLLEEILGHQTAEVHRFLLYTSILDQLTAPLCDAMLEDHEGSLATRPSCVILEELEHANLFIIPLDHEQRWYRYHPLFAELLRGYLQKNDPLQVPILHTRAITWFEEQGMISEAIRHSFAVNDWEHVVRLISANIFALLEQNELNSVARQLEDLSCEENSARPWLLIGRAWLAAYTGQLSAVEPILKLAESEIDNLNSEVELQTLGGHIAAIRAYTNWIGDKRDIAASAAQVALEWLPANERLIRCQAATLLGLTLDNLDAREEALERAIEYAKECRVSHVTIFAHGCWAWMLAIQGKLHEAHAACLEAIRLAQSGSPHQSLPTLSHVYSTLGLVLLEWNDIEAAIHYSREAVDLARRWEQADALHFALTNLGYALFACGDVQGAFDTLRQAWQVASHTSTWFEQITISQEIEWDLALNNLEAAEQRLSLTEVDITDPSRVFLKDYLSQLMPLSIIQIYLAQKQYSKALTMIALKLDNWEKMNIGYYLISTYILQAVAYHELKQAAQAQVSLKRALMLASPGGVIRSFINKGPVVISLLKRMRLEGVMPDYIDRLLVAYGQPVQPPSTQSVATSCLVEPLSGREIEVLKLLVQGCQDKKIAETLVIARETVHKHLKNIYGKLDVHSRSEAAARARELGIL
jgi:LuxR family maltose regulon positive regulatory protein